MNLKKTLMRLAAACIAAATLLTGAAHAELPSDYQVILLTENFPPFNMADDDKNFARAENIHGMNADVIREMFDRAGIGYDLSLRFPWDRLYNLALEKPNYAIFSTTLNESRKPLFKWVGPLSTTERVLVAAPGKQFDLKSLEDATRYRIGAYKNSSTSQFLEKHDVPFESSLRDQENIQKLMNGQIDLWATNDPVFRYFARQEGVSGLQVVLVAEAGTQQYLALNLETPDEVVQRLQAALDAMKKDGTVARIAQTYLGATR